MKKVYPDQAKLKKLLHYDPDSGIFTWLVREGDDKKTKAWNARWAGKRAGSVYNTGHWTIMIDSQAYQASKLACIYVTGSCPERVLFSNKDGSDNRFCNLIASDCKGLAKRTRKYRNNTSNVTGVCKGYKGKFVAQICANNQDLWLGTFDTIEEATLVRRTAESRLGFSPCHGR